jgi:hypothetical protein
MYRYTVINVSDSPKRALLIRTRDIFSAILGLRDIKLNFIREDPNGPVHYDYPILGYVHLNGKEIFIRADIYDLREQVRTVLHELRHCYQRQSGRHYATNAARERDARLFEYEYLPPFDPAAIERWLDEVESRLIRTVQHVYYETVRTQQQSFLGKPKFI